VSLRKKILILLVALASTAVLLLAVAPGNQDRSPLAKTMAEESAAWFDREEDLSTLGADLRANRVAAIGVAERYALVSRTDDTRYYVNVPTGHEHRAVDPASVRPRLAEAAAESVEDIQRTLLDAATSASKPAWVEFECTDCGNRKRVEVPIPVSVLGLQRSNCCSKAEIEALGWRS